jgi:magnesium-dependent phosphatase-1
MTSKSLAFMDEGSLPEVCALDCDYTLWRRDCDKNVLPPFQRWARDFIVDRYGRDASAHPDVADIIGALYDRGVKIAFVSRNPSANYIEQLLKACPMNSKNPEKDCLWDSLESRSYFHAYSSEQNGKGKDKHFAALRDTTGTTFSSILFFDDFQENVDAANAQGSTAVLVDKVRGLDWTALECGIQEWRRRNVTEQALSEIKCHA